MMLTIAIKNLLARPVSALLSWLLLTVSIGLISLLLLLQQKLDQVFAGFNKVDLVIGAKGSPLQLVLSALYHLDAPTGNISLHEAERWMRHPFVAAAAPLAYGDNYKGYAIVGTNADYLRLLAPADSALAFPSGRGVLAGAGAAHNLSLRAGDHFVGSHGSQEGGEEHEDFPYTVQHILQPTGTAVDNMLLTSIEAVHEIHEHHEHSNVNEHTEEQEHTAEKEEEVTAVLLQLRNPMAKLQWPRKINEETSFQAAVPVMEINRLFSLLGIGIELAGALALVIMLLAATSIFVTLYQSLADKKYELALLRSLGFPPIALLLLLLWEALLLSLAACVAGALLARVALWWLLKQSPVSYGAAHGAWPALRLQEMAVFAGALAVAVLAALLPALRAFYLNISKTLSHAQP
ncbi:MAG: FtsX-like permease family protein [Flavihumibacter sp.]